jgi:hypothetical protein
VPVSAPSGSSSTSASETISSSSGRTPVVSQSNTAYPAGGGTAARRHSRPGRPGLSGRSEEADGGGSATGSCGARLILRACAGSRTEQNTDLGFTNRSRHRDTASLRLDRSRAVSGARRVRRPVRQVRSRKLERDDVHREEAPPLLGRLVRMRAITAPKNVPARARNRVASAADRASSVSTSSQARTSAAGQTLASRAVPARGSALKA